MAIAASDIKFYFSEKVSGNGFTTAGSAAASLGKNISTTEITDNTLNNLFDDVSGDENAASDVEYRCIFVHNGHATLTWTSVVAWLSAEVAGGAAIAIAKDDIGATDKDSTDDQAATIADEGADPSASTGDWSTATSKATGVALGDLAPDECIAIWVRRTAANTVAVDSDGVTISVAGDTAA
jgi:hypothetical protein